MIKELPPEELKKMREDWCKTCPGIPGVDNCNECRESWRNRMEKKKNE